MSIVCTLSGECCSAHMLLGKYAPQLAHGCMPFPFDYRLHEERNSVSLSLCYSFGMHLNLIDILFRV